MEMWSAESIVKSEVSLIGVFRGNSTDAPIIVWKRTHCVFYGIVGLAVCVFIADARSAKAWCGKQNRVCKELRKS